MGSPTRPTRNGAVVVQFDSLSEFFAMGGHAQYVWMAYGAAALVFVGYALTLRNTRTRILKELKWQVKASEIEEVDRK